MEKRVLFKSVWLPWVLIEPQIAGGLARDHLLRLAGTGRLVFFSVFGLERSEFAAAAD